MRTRNYNDNQMSLFDSLEMTATLPPVEVAELTPIAQAVTEIIEPEEPVREMYRFNESVLETLKGPRAKALANVRALEVLKKLEMTTVATSATQDEKDAMVAYTGWGGLSEVFATNSEHQDIQDRLRSILTEEEFKSAKESVLTAYYTEPHIVRAMWEIVRGYGFTHGRICEPSAGVGHFIGCMPDDVRAKSHVVAVEIDSVSAGLTRQIYGDTHTHVNCTGIEKTSYVDEFDLVIGNVPFGNYRVSDRRLDHLKVNIHEYFVAKALDMVRPGGLVALIITSAMLDRESNSYFKDYMLQRAKFLKAIRLPSGAFKRLGGTDVVADIVVLQKRAKPLSIEELENLDGVEGTVRSLKGCGGFPEVFVCSYFVDKPEHVMGSVHRTFNQYGKQLAINAHEDWVQRLQAVASEPVQACFNPEANVSIVTASLVKRVSDPTCRKSIVSVGFFFDEEGRLMHIDDRNRVEPQDNLPAATYKRVEGMTRIRDCALRLLEADARHSSNAALIREELNGLYERFVKQFSYLLSPTNRRLFRNDSHAPFLWSLESWDDENEVGVKADLFFKSTISMATLPESVDTVEDGIALSYNKVGRLDVELIAKAMGTTRADVRQQLLEKGMAFIDPSVGEVVDSTEYLSGDVRKKLDEAKIAAKSDSSFEVNVTALDGVQPMWLPLSQIQTKLGSPWIGPGLVMQWLVKTFDLKPDLPHGRGVSVTYVPATASWLVSTGVERASIFRTEWGTSRKNFWDILRCLLNQQTPEVYDLVDVDGKEKRVLNRNETLACQERAEMIQARFMEWLFASPEHCKEVEYEYNMRFNSHVNRSYDGSHLVIPGLNPQIELRQAQKDSIWRGIISGNTLYALAVGGGKTLIQICLAQEYKRLGLAAKPVLVVPNHMLEAFAGEYLRAFPRAKVLVISKDDMQGERRKTILMRAATNDWDCIIVTHSTFGMIGVSDECITQFISDCKDQAAETVLGMNDRNVVREAMRAAKQVEHRLKSLTTMRRDDGLLTFEDIGIDMILVDEADIFKNLFFFTKKKRIPGISSAFSARALDLFIKSRLVFERRGTKGSGLIFSTATPISNTIGEMFIMQTFLQEERLQELSIASFDAWAASFAREVTCVEVKPEGSGYRLHTRFAQFVNVPELMRIFREVTEIRTKAMLKLPEPKLYGGSHQVIAVPASEPQKAYVQSLVERAEAIRKGEVKPNEDNMLCVTGDGRKAALDIRCVFPKAPNDPNSKVNVCIDKVHQIWEQYRDERATQLIFCDLSVPGTPGFSVYDHIRDSLVSRGVPQEEIAFAQDWDTDAKKAQLHRKVRAGKIRILIGSTELMGFGTNVQDRLIAKHDLDAPWRPRDVEQRDGRIIRQGCMHDTVWIYRYVTEGTFDAYMWQTLERKARFIAQVMENDGSARAVEDVTSQALSYAEVKALASGNPIVIEKAAVDAEVAKLTAIRDVYLKDQSNLRWKVQNMSEEVKYLKETLTKLNDWLKEAKLDTSQVHVEGMLFADILEASRAIMRRSRQFQKMLSESKSARHLRERCEMFTSGNIRVYAQTSAGSNDVGEWASVESVKGYEVKVRIPYATADIGEWLEEGGPIKEARNRAISIDQKIADYEREIADAKLHIGKAFEHEDKLKAALQRKAEIDAALEIDTDEVSALELDES